MEEQKLIYLPMISLYIFVCVRPHPQLSLSIFISLHYSWTISTISLVCNDVDAYYFISSTQFHCMNFKLCQFSVEHAISSFISMARKRAYVNFSFCTYLQMNSVLHLMVVFFFSSLLTLTWIETAVEQKSCELLFFPHTWLWSHF